MDLIGTCLSRTACCSPALRPMPLRIGMLDFDSAHKREGSGLAHFGPVALGLAQGALTSARLAQGDESRLPEPLEDACGERGLLRSAQKRHPAVPARRRPARRAAVGRVA